MRHELKTWPEWFKPILDGAKRCEVRKNDRNFSVNDVLELREWDPKTGYTGRSINVLVTHILGNEFGGLANGFVAMSITTSLED